MVPNWMLGLIWIGVGRLGEFSFMSRNEVTHCGSVTANGMDLDEKVNVEDVDDPDVVGCFLEMIEGITRELCSLLLRACSKEIEVDQLCRTNWGGEAGGPIPNDPRQNTVEHIWYEYFQQFVTDAKQEVSEKSIRLTGNAHGIAK